MSKQSNSCEKMQAEVVKTNRGRDLLIVGAYEYYLENVEDEAKVWMCAHSTKCGFLGTRCDVKVKTNLTGDLAEEPVGEHQHDIPWFAKERRQFNQELRQGI